MHQDSHATSNSYATEPRYIDCSRTFISGGRNATRPSRKRWNSSLYTHASMERQARVEAGGLHRPCCVCCVCVARRRIGPFSSHISSSFEHLSERKRQRTKLSLLLVRMLPFPRQGAPRPPTTSHTSSRGVLAERNRVRWSLTAFFFYGSSWKKNKQKKQHILEAIMLGSYMRLLLKVESLAVSTILVIRRLHVDNSTHCFSLLALPTTRKTFDPEGLELPSP